MSRVLPFLAALALLAFTGVEHGLRTHRWTVSHEIEDAVPRPNRIPLTIGDWEGTSSELDARERKSAGIAGYALRHYVNRRDGSAVQVLLVCGTPGKISVHTPDICFPGSGAEKLSLPVRSNVAYSYSGEQRTAAFFWADYARQRVATPTNQRVLWSWCGGGTWRAPDNPRITHSGYGVLYKLYVIRETSKEASALQDDPSIAFLKVFLPEADRVLAAR
jgi:hypothetical protein